MASTIDICVNHLKIDHRQLLRRSAITADVQQRSVRSSMSSQPSSRRATTRASKKIGDSEHLGVDGDGAAGVALV